VISMWISLSKTSKCGIMSHYHLVAWLSGSTLVSNLSINVVTLRRARLILGWVTVSG